MNKFLLGKILFFIALLTITSGSVIHAAAAGGGDAPEKTDSEVRFAPELRAMIYDDGNQIKIDLLGKPTGINTITLTREPDFSVTGPYGADLSRIPIYEQGGSRLNMLHFGNFLRAGWKNRAPAKSAVDLFAVEFDPPQKDIRLTNPWLQMIPPSEHPYSFYGILMRRSIPHQLAVDLNAALKLDTVSSISDLDALAANLESKGVPRELFFSFFPRYPGTNDPVYVIPEQEMIKHIEKMVQDFVFTGEINAQDNLDLLRRKISEFKGASIGPVPLGLQLERVEFPLNWVITKALTKKQAGLSEEARIRCLDAALLAQSQIDPKDYFRASIKDIPTASAKDLSTLLKARIKEFLAASISEPIPEQLRAEFLALLPEATSRWIMATEFPLFFFMGKYFSTLGEDEMKELAALCFALVKEGEKAPGSKLDYCKAAQGKLAQIRSHFVHAKFAQASDKSKRCQLVIDYLDCISRSDRTVFPQKLVDNNVSRLALGPWDPSAEVGEKLPFSVDCADRRTVALFCEHLATQQEKIFTANHDGTEQAPSYFTFKVPMQDPLTVQLAHMVCLSAEAQGEFLRLCRVDAEEKLKSANGGDE